MLVDKVKALAAAIGADIKSLAASLAGKVDKVSGKGLSANDYTTAEKSKLAGLATVATSGAYSDLSGRPGLGTAANRDVQTSPTDKTAGSLMSVGAFGLGAPVKLTSAYDLNTVFQPGFYNWDGNLPANTPGSNAYSHLQVTSWGDAGSGQQLLITSMGVIWFRNKINTATPAWGAWTRIPFIAEAIANFAGNLPVARVTGLATVATSGSYNDLSNRPSIPAAQVPADWNASSGVARILNKPGNATTSAAGLMSATDKSKLDGMNGGIASWTTATRPTSGEVRFGFNSTHGGLEYWNGVAWLRLSASNVYSASFGTAMFGNHF